MAGPVLGFSQEHPGCQNRFEHAGVEKLYTGSSDKWRNYASYLADLRPH
jgi:hypothetical protein